MEAPFMLQLCLHYLFGNFGAIQSKNLTTQKQRLNFLKFVRHIIFGQL